MIIMSVLIIYVRMSVGASSNEYVLAGSTDDSKYSSTAKCFG